MSYITFNDILKRKTTLLELCMEYFDQFSEWLSDENMERREYSFDDPWTSPNTIDATEEEKSIPQIPVKVTFKQNNDKVELLVESPWKFEFRLKATKTITNGLEGFDIRIIGSV